MSSPKDFFDFLNKEMNDELEGSEEESAEADPDAPLLSEEFSVNIPLNGSPLSPRIWTGESAKPLSTGPYPDSGAVGDDNITNTWHGLMSFFG